MSRVSVACISASLVVGLAAASSAAPPPLSRTLLSSSRCLDGSPSGYYYRPAAAPSTTWVIFLEGGGACYTPADCAARAKTDLGSSSGWAPTIAADGVNVLSPAQSENPLLFSAHHVFVPYCGGDVHSGTRTAPASAELPFYFSGALTLAGVLRDLAARGLAGATDVLLSGDSAGGLGTFLNARAVRAALPLARVKAAPQAGWFFPHVVNYTAWQSGDSGPPWAGESEAVTDLWQTQLPPECIAAHNKSYCSSITDAFPYYLADGLPLHIANDLQDSNQVFAQLGAPNVTPRTPQLDAFIEYFRAAMASALGQVAAAAVAGHDVALWAPACLEHVENVNLDNKTRINGVSYRDSLDSWLRGDALAPRIAIDACKGTNCNPSC